MGRNVAFVPWPLLQDAEELCRNVFMHDSPELFVRLPDKTEPRIPGEIHVE